MLYLDWGFTGAPFGFLSPTSKYVERWRDKYLWPFTRINRFFFNIKCVEMISILYCNTFVWGHAAGGAVGWGTALQVGGSRVRFPMVSLDFFHWHNPSGCTMALGSTQPLTERRADNLTTFMCWLSSNLGASTSWNPWGLSRPVMGVLYFFTFV
jgi:hypothetical protein